MIYVDLKYQIICSRVTNRCAELEKNNNLEREKANALKESQCDIIAYLSRQVEMKNNEIIDLGNTISTLKTVSNT